MVLVCSLTYAAALTYARRHRLKPDEWAWLHEPLVIQNRPGAKVVRTYFWRGRSNAAEIDAELAAALTSGRVAELTDVE